jgi:hypothetical protein
LGVQRFCPFCTKSFIRVDNLMESPKLAERLDRSVSLGHHGFAVQVEVADRG